MKITKTVSIKKYNIKSWVDKYPDHNVNIKNLYIHPDWSNFFNDALASTKVSLIEDHLKRSLDATDGKVKMYPYPDLIFHAINLTPLSELKVVIIGQDPYHQNNIVDKTIVPQAMGMAFSVPIGVKIPSSLKNIYKNLVAYGHIDNIPAHGNLEQWAKRGVLMINTALTVQHGCPNSHAKYWNWLTDDLIKYISDNTDSTVFVLWGNPAYKKKMLIDLTKHSIVASSHPSGLSCHKPMGSQPAFNNQDHFKLINENLLKSGKSEIDWSL